MVEELVKKERKGSGESKHYISFSKTEDGYSEYESITNAGYDVKASILPALKRLAAEVE